MLPDDQARAEGRAPTLFLLFLATMTSVIALTIDAILPALDAISEDLGFADPSDRQLIVLAVFAGIGLGQPVFGPLSDAIGRRPAAMLGWALYVAGTVVAMLAPSLGWIVAGRVVQGLGAAGPRVVATAIVRDLYQGRAMARIVSLIMTVFMLVPMFAPLIGQGLEALAGWRAIFGLYLAMAVLSAAWHMTIPETLPPESRRPLRVEPLARAFAEVLTTRATMLYTAGAGMIFAAFAAFLAAAQQVYEEIYGLGDLFPVVFALMALVFAVAQFANSMLVMRVGMRGLCRAAAMMVTTAGGRGDRGGRELGDAALAVPDAPVADFRRRGAVVLQPAGAGARAARAHRRDGLGGGDVGLDAGGRAAGHASGAAGGGLGAADLRRLRRLRRADAGGCPFRRPGAPVRRISA